MIIRAAPVGPAVVNPSDDPCFTLTGSVKRIDKPIGSGAFFPDVVVPARFINIEVSEEDLVFDDTYAELRTDVNGNWSASFCDDDGIFDDTLEIYIEIESEIYDGDYLVAEVVDSSYLDEVYEFEGEPVSSEGGALHFDVTLDAAQSEIVNILDAAYDGWDFFRASGGEAGGADYLDDEITLHWEVGYPDDTSYYFRDGGFNEITITSDSSDPDAWDDPVILHELGHMIDDYYSCDDFAAGEHTVNTILPTDRTFGEGYPDYFQSAVRRWRGDASARLYSDVRANGGGSFDLESFDLFPMSLLDPANELAVAATLWDLNDSEVDGQDTVSHGHALIQQVYTDDTFNDADTCDFTAYMRAWVEDGLPTDAATAAVVAQNTGLTTLPGTLVQSAEPVLRPGLLPFSAPTNYKWWNQVALVVDNSSSMAGPKLNAVKTVLQEQVDDLSKLQQGTEFTLQTFSNASSANQPVFTGQFFGSRMQNAIAGLTPRSDTGCKTNAFRALSQAVAGKYGVDAWVFTDGDTNITNPSIANVQQMLNDHRARTSFALFDVCPTVAVQAEEEQANERRLRNAAASYVGPAAANAAPGGVVPYLLTASSSGGQFLFVGPDQAQNAADILQAQLTHSAGAGRWSDYVSDRATYQFDELTSWEYKWIDAKQGGTNAGSPEGDHVNIPLPQPFKFYNAPIGFNTLRAYDSGYLGFGTAGANQPSNSPLPSAGAPNNALYPFWDSIIWDVPCAASETAEAPQACTNSAVHYKQDGDWFVIQYDPFRSVDFEVLLHASSGEIRYQYLAVDTANSATIGLENSNGTDAVQVSHNTAAGASANMGYKFTPAPPQPTKSYAVAVDNQMKAVGFLLTGFSGSFDPLTVHYPDGSAVSCANTANVLCLNLGLVQYIQADVDGRVGEWQATVGAGAGGVGTFSFSSFAAGALSPSSPSDRSLSTTSATPLIVDLAQAVDGNVLTGSFRTPTNLAFGPQFTLFDDGAHGDGAANDGRFGSAPFTPPGAGTGYLWLDGKLDGALFTRVDPVPFSFHPLRVTSLGDASNGGDVTTLQFRIQNDDSFAHCYAIEVQVPVDWVLVPQIYVPPCLAPGAATIRSVPIRMSDTAPNTLPSGTSGDVVFSAVEIERGMISDSATAKITRHRPVASIAVHAQAASLRPGGDTTEVVFSVVDVQGRAVADGTELQLFATNGTISPTVGTTKDGSFTATFSSGAQPGDAVVSATVAQAVTGSRTIPIRVPEPHMIQLSLSTITLPADGMSTAEVVATVLDKYGNPVANQALRIGVEGDSEMGNLNGQEVVTGVTDAQGAFTATFRSGTVVGDAWLRAELVVQEGDTTRYALESRQVIHLTGLGYRVYLPLVVRQ